MNTISVSHCIWHPELKGLTAVKKNDYGYTIGGPVWIPGLYNTKKEKHSSCLDQSFLHPSGAHNPRILQLGMKFIF